MKIESAFYIIGFLCSAGLCAPSWSQDAPKATGQKSDAGSATAESPSRLRDGQMAISGRYARFERMLSQMADVLSRQDPERADLLRRAIGKGREDQVKEDIEKVVSLLDKGELGSASETQAEVVASLETLLKLLQTEDRRSSAERERERLNELLKNVREVLSIQKSARAATQNSEAPSSAAPAQQNAIREAEKLLEEMREQQGKDSNEGQQPLEGESENKEISDSGEKKETDRDTEGKDKNSEADPSLPTEPRESAEGQSKDQKSQQQNPSSPQEPGEKKADSRPGQEQVEKAKSQMEKALQQLKDQNREKAIDHEDQAIEELNQAAEQLEKMLQQLREEEKEMLLATLEARLQRMLMAQTQIAEATSGLAATPKENWLDQYFGRCRELAQQQSELERECSQTVNLLREDGTSVSVLMTVEDIELDMRSVSGWLQDSSVGALTQSVQNDIIDSLKLLLETMQREMEEMKQQKKDQSKRNNSQSKSQLVELMAEIRMLRNLQLQVNRRTKQVNDLMLSGSAEDLATFRNQLVELATRQQRLVDSAKELAKQSR